MLWYSLSFLSLFHLFFYLPNFVYQAICVENVAASCRACRAVPNFTLHLLPSVNIFNRLPLSLRILLPAPEQALEIEPGGKAVTHCFDLSKLNKVSVEVRLSNSLIAVIKIIFHCGMKHRVVKILCPFS